jgi:hypothetical protein
MADEEKSNFINVRSLTVLGGFVAMLFSGWFALQGQFTARADHNELAAEVQQVGRRTEETKVQNDLRWFLFQYRTECKGERANSEHCQWLAAEIANLQRLLQQLRPPSR